MRSRPVKRCRDENAGYAELRLINRTLDMGWMPSESVILDARRFDRLFARWWGRLWLRLEFNLRCRRTA